jgi:Transposase DDE domain group 1
MVAKLEWHPGELYPRVGFTVTNMTRPPERVTMFYDQRGTAEQYIREVKNAVTWTRLSCRRVAQVAAVWLISYSSTGSAGHPCSAAIKVRTRDNLGEKEFWRLRRREGEARPKAQAPERTTLGPAGARVVW